MRSRTLSLVLNASVAILAVVLVAPAAGSTVLPAPVATPALRDVAAPPFRTVAGILPQVSTNWAGFVVEGPFGSVSDVRGSWIVPAIQGACPATNAYSFEWIGIDGWGSSTVEQTGTESDCVKGVATYAAWYEFFPASSHVLTKLVIQPGDTMSAEVVFSGGRFTVSITDVTTGASFTRTKQDSKALRVSAEWIAEAPSSGGGILPLADFGTVPFGADYTDVASTCTATVGGTSGTIGALDALGSYLVLSLTMVAESGAPKAVPSALSSDGTSFTVAWAAAGP